MFEKMMSGKKYPFKISNTGRTNEGVFTRGVF